MNFEEIPEISERIKRSKMELQDNGLYWAQEWDSQSCSDQDFVNNFRKGWLARQGEIDHLNSVLEERTKEWLQAIELGDYFENVAKPLKAELDEKDARIKKATAKWISIASILTTTNTSVPDVIFQQLDELHDALAGIDADKALGGDQ